MPTEIAGGDADTACQQTLLELGAVFTPTSHTPDGYPNLICEIDDPVLLYGPIGGVGLEDGNGNDGPVLVGCDTAVSIVGSAAVAQMLGAETIIHFGTYDCRAISGTSTLSEHGHDDHFHVDLTPGGNTYD